MSRTVPQAMEEFVASLEISEREEREAVRQRDVILDHLRGAFEGCELLISGSFKRKTAIRPLHDVDLFIILDARSHETLASGSPSGALASVRAVLDRAYPNKEEPGLQRRSVNIEFKGTGIAFDVVPAFRHGADEYLIPDRVAWAWIRSDPRRHAQHAAEANERASSMAKPIVKALKHWLRRRGDIGVRSFHLELMVYDALTSKPAGYARGIATALRHMVARVQREMPEPAGIGPAVDQGMTPAERSRAAACFAEAAGEAERALQFAERGATGQAHAIWRALLGEVYPEPGSPAPAARAAAVDGPRAPGARFA